MDKLLELVEAYVRYFGLPDPDALVGGRRSRLVASVVVFAASGTIPVFALRQTLWLMSITMLAVLFALWVGLFSAIDALKEWPRPPWQSLLSIVFCALAASLAIRLAVGV